MRSKTLCLAAFLGAVLAAGCGRSLHTVLPLGNQRPTVKLLGLPPDTSSTIGYRVTLYWTGFDADGQIDHFIYALDPPGTGDTLWVRTKENSGTFPFAATDPRDISLQRSTFSQLHSFVVKAVDNLGQPSAPAWRSFNAFTVAPVVQILTPQPSPLLFERTAPSAWIRWTATDPDAPEGAGVRRYKFKLFLYDDPAIDPHDLSKLNRLGPAFVGWDSLPPETTSVLFPDLVPDQKYIFALTAIDEAQAWDPVFNRATSVLAFQATYANQLGPVLTLFNDFFRFTYPEGGFSSDVSRYVRIEVPAGVVVPIRWSAQPTDGAVMRRYRWALDIQDLGDETARTDEIRDVSHWSHWSLNTTTAALGPFEGLADQSTTHLFYLEAEENTGLLSLAIVQMRVIPFLRDRPLLVVDDRRGTPDQYRSYNKVGPPSGSWPSEAELDTFYFARGGAPWKGYDPTNGLPQQLLSPPGIFLGYDFDTLDTRGFFDPTVPISVIARYRNIIWYLDAASADMRDGPTDPFSPKTSLRYMTGAGRFNSLSLFLSRGGRLLLFGGGGVTATVREWGDADAVFTTVPDPEASMVPGRFPWDVLHMRAGMKIGQISQISVSPRRPAGFSGLVNLRHRNLADPPPPFRTSVPRYPWVEYVYEPLRVYEDRDSDPAVFDSLQTLDTLFVAQGIAATGEPCGFYYHGKASPPIIYLGFDLWSWQRAQLIQTFDWLLQNVWGLPREPLPRDEAAPRGAAAAPPPNGR